MDHEDPSEVTEITSSVGGAVVGTALGILTDPWIGSAGGAVVTRLIRSVGSEVEKRFVGERQERRLVQASEVIASEFHERLAADELLRADGFFDAGEDPAPAEDLLEGVLRTAVDSWDSKKVPYIGQIFPSLSFDESESPAEATYLLRLTDRLTYRQLILIAFWEGAQRDGWPYAAKLGDIIEAGISADVSVLAEMNELAAMRLLGIVRSSGEVTHPGQTIAGLENFGAFGDQVDLRTVTLTPMGRRLHRLMRLDAVPDADRRSILSDLFRGP